MRILVFPRDGNPYQNFLYNEMCRHGVRVAYLGEWTPSHSLNILLLPLETIVRRILGERIIHLHWARPFMFPGSPRFRTVRQISQFWFLLWLRTCRMLGMHLVWTAHNVLPLFPLFADDMTARRALVRTSDLVLAHSESALNSLAEMGMAPRRSAVIPHGPFAPDKPVASLRVPGSDQGPCRFLFIGRVEEYKGVDDLLSAFDSMPNNVASYLTVAGQCPDSRLQARVLEYSGMLNASIIVGPDRLSEARMTELIAAADVVVLPFRRITTSGSVMLALSHGRPVIVPDVPTLADLPDAAVVRYDGSISGLTSVMTQMAMTDRSILVKMSESALQYAYRLSWQDIASETKSEMVAILGAEPLGGP